MKPATPSISSPLHILYRPATSKDINHIAGNMREIDLDYLREVHGAALDMRKLLKTSVEISPGAQTRVDASTGEPLAIRGISPVKRRTGRGIVWAIGAQATYQPNRLREYVSEGRQYLQEMLKRYCLLENYINARNDGGIRFLESIGLTVHPPTIYGLHGVPFRHFTIERRTLH